MHGWTTGPRRALQWLAGSRTDDVPRSWRRCPICGRDLVGRHPAGALVSGPTGSMRLEPGRAELVAKCPVHGRSPATR